MDGILLASDERSAAGISRTIVNGVASEAANEVNQNNEASIEYEIFTAILDGRTSDICRGFHGQKFKVGEGPIPSLHKNCRSMRVPYIKGIDD